MSETTSSNGGSRMLSPTILNNLDNPTPPQPSPSPNHALTNPNMYVFALCQRSEWATVEQALRNCPREAATYKDEQTGETALMLAIKENRLVIIERLLELGANLNEKTKENRTPLHYAAAYGKDDTVRLLATKRPDGGVQDNVCEQLPLHLACARPNSLQLVKLLLPVSSKDGSARLVLDKESCIPLMYAIEQNNLLVVKELIERFPDQQFKIRRKLHGDTAIHVAARKHHADLLVALLEAGADPNVQNNDGQTALHIAAGEGDESTMKALQQFKANANIYDNEDRSPLHLAAQFGQSKAVEFLVDKFRANVLARTKDGSTLMHIASIYGHPETTLAFLKKGVPMNMPNKNGALCLHAAAMRGHAHVLKSLLDRGHDVDVRTKDNYTALHIAVEHDRPDAVQTLLGYGAQIEFKGGAAQETPLHIASRRPNGDKCAEMLVKSGANVNNTMENGESAMHIAARNGNLKMMRTLLHEGANALMQSKSGETALHVATRYCQFTICEALVSHVHQTRAKQDAIQFVNMVDQEGESALHYACEIKKTQIHAEFEDIDIIKLLMKYGGEMSAQTKFTLETPLHYCARTGNSDVLLEIVNYHDHRILMVINKQAKNGRSPLLFSCEGGHYEVAKVLLARHARVDVFDDQGKSALHLAADNGHTAVVELLLQYKAFVNAKSKTGLTPLHGAAQNGHDELVRLLIDKYGASVDALSLNKRTPLHLAALFGKMHVCQLLLRMGASPNSVDANGQMPLHLAAENDHAEIFRLFLKYHPELVTNGAADKNGMTCAHIAAQKGSINVIRELIKYNREVTSAKNLGNGVSLLHLAAAGGHCEVIKALLQGGAKQNQETSDGMTALMLAAQHGHMQVLEVLTVNWLTASKKSGFTALHIAARHGQTEFVREMLTQVPGNISTLQPKNNVYLFKDVLKDFGLTPLHLASQFGHESIVRLLLNSDGVVVDAATATTGTIPLHLAAQSGDTAVASLLLSKSTHQVHIKDNQGRIPLHLAAANGWLDLVTLFLTQGSEINLADKEGYTPLHYASKTGHLEVVKVLLETGAMPKAESVDGKNALSHAAAHQKLDVVSYFLGKTANNESMLDNSRFLMDMLACSKQNSGRTIYEFITMSSAPVDVAAKLSMSYHDLSESNKEQIKDIMKARRFCEAQCTRLLLVACSVGNNQTRRENGALTTALTAKQILEAVDDKGVSFLDVLIACELKHAVKQQVVQNYLTEIWNGGQTWSAAKTLLLLMAFLLLPPVWVAFSLPIRHRFIKIPLIRFLSYLVSNIYLIVLFALICTWPLEPVFQEVNNSLASWNEWLLLAWLAGYLVSELTNPSDSKGFGVIRLFVIAMSVCGVICHVVAVVLSDTEIDSAYDWFFARNLFYAVAMLCTFIALIDFLTFHHMFGPWSIIIKALMNDLFRFLVILIIFVAGFTFSITTLYNYVTPNPNDASDTTIGSQTALSVFEACFWGIFGFLDPTFLPPVDRTPYWTLALTKFYFGLYLLLVFHVLINILIAMLTDTYQEIQDKSDKEWKFGRAKLIRNMSKTCPSPAPLILVTKFLQYCAMGMAKITDCNRVKGLYFYETESTDDSRTGGDLAGRSPMIQAGVSDFLRPRRGTRVFPDSTDTRQRQPSISGSFRLQPSERRKELQKIESVVDWKTVCARLVTEDHNAVAADWRKPGVHKKKRH